MTDFHSHILPGIDDGSRNVDMSLAMLAMEREQNVDRVVLTPHFYAQEDSVDQFLKRRSDSLMELKQAADQQGAELPRLCVGAEVYYFRDISRAAMVSKLCIDDTPVLLLEMPFCQWEQAMYDDIVRLWKKQNLTVVLAHIERYAQFQKKKDVWDAVLELPVYFQMNAGPFTNWKTRGKSLRLLKELDAVLLGSDSHNLTSRKPNLEEGRAVIADKLGDSYIKRARALDERLLGE